MDGSSIGSAGRNEVIYYDDGINMRTNLIDSIDFQDGHEVGPDRIVVGTFGDVQRQVRSRVSEMHLRILILEAKYERLCDTNKAIILTLSNHQIGKKNFVQILKGEELSSTLIS